MEVAFQEDVAVGAVAVEDHGVVDAEGDDSKADAAVNHVVPSGSVHHDGEEEDNSWKDVQGLFRSSFEKSFCSCFETHFQFMFR